MLNFTLAIWLRSGLPILYSKVFRFTFSVLFFIAFSNLFFSLLSFAKIFFLSHFHSFTFSCLITPSKKIYVRNFFFVVVSFRSFELSRTKGTKAMKNGMLHFEWGYITSHNFKRDRCFDLFHFSLSLSFPISSHLAFLHITQCQIAGNSSQC